MQKYLQINCGNIELRQENGEIVIKIKAKLKADVRNRFQQKVVLTHEEQLQSKNQIYAELFKSKVVQPPPPPSEPQPQIQREKVDVETGKKEEERGKNIFGTSQTERQPQISATNPFRAGPSTSMPLERQPQRNERRENSFSFRNQNIFSSSRDSHREPSPSYPSTFFERDNRDRDNRDSRDNRDNRDSWNRGDSRDSWSSRDRGESRDNRDKAGQRGYEQPSSDSTNIFMTGNNSSVPSLFSTLGQNENSNSSNNRSYRQNKKDRYSKPRIS